MTSKFPDDMKGQDRHRERGAILFIVAASLVVLLGVAGLAFDLGFLYNVKTDLQNAVDAAALAGAWKLNGTSSGITDAVASAQAAANKYKFNNNPIALADNEVTFSTQRDSGYQIASDVINAGIAANIKFVRASKNTVVELALIKVIPGVGSTQNVAAYAVAGQSPPLNEICDGIVPLSPVPQASGGTMDQYQIGHYYGYRLAPGNNVSNVGSGNYLLLDFSPVIGGNSGGAEIRDLLSGALKGCVPLNQPICTKTGVTAGPVRQGLNQRFDDDTNKYEYTNDSALDQYKLYISDNSSDHPGYPAGNGRRVFVVPFVSTQPGVWAPFDNGKNCPVYVLNYGCFFMREKVPGGNGGDIQGEYIGTCNVNGYFDPGATPPPSVGLPGITKLVLYR